MRIPVRIAVSRLSALQVAGLVSVALLVSWPAAIGAAEPSLEVQLQPERFGVEDLAQLTVRVNEPPTDLGVPQIGGLDNLEIVGGPSTGSEFSFVNGVASRAQTFTYVLRALQPGPATVGTVTVAAGSVELGSNPITVEVVEGSVAPRSRRSRRSPFSTDPFGDLMPRRPPPRVEVELRHVVSARGGVVGQPLVATVYLDSTASALSDFNWRSAPAYPGFWAQRLDNPEQITPEVVEIDGVRYYRYQVMQSVLVPLKSGEIEIPAIEAAIGVRSRGFFDTGQLLERSSPIQTLEIAARPAAPPGFGGAVGDLDYSARIEPTEIEFGESTVLTVSLEGRGNLPLVEAPSVFPSCEGCDSYPPEEDSRITVDAAGIRGSRQWQVTVVPQTWGELVLEAVTLAVFDPSTGGYVEQTIGPLELTVLPPPPTPTPIVTPGPATAGAAGESADDVETETGISPGWLLVVGALVLGAMIGSAATWLIGRRVRIQLPPRRRDQSPADRARVLQLTLERWWLDARTTERGAELEKEMQGLRSDLEAVRFAPGRADHTDTIVDLENRLKRLMRRA